MRREFTLACRLDGVGLVFGITSLPPSSPAQNFGALQLLMRLTSLPQRNLRKLLALLKAMKMVLLMMMRAVLAQDQKMMRMFQWRTKRSLSSAKACLSKHRLQFCILIDTAPVNDGEEGEATLLQFKAKLYTLVSRVIGWKERGFGTLKLNVPKSFVDYDENGVPVLGSFDPSGAYDDDEEGGKSNAPAARLIMRQENTHRVILNTVILRALKFEEKPGAAQARIVFTAFEDGKPVNMLFKVSSGRIIYHRSTR